MDFSKQIKHLCKERGIDLKTLAKRLEITPISLSQTLHQSYPQLQSLERIANALGVEVRELFAPSDEVTITCPHCGKAIRIKFE